MLEAWHTDVGVLAALCDMDPDCAGFNTNGRLKSNVTGRVATAGVNLYVKVAGPAEPEGPPRPGAGAQRMAILPQRSRSHGRAAASKTSRWRKGGGAGRA